MQLKLESKLPAASELIADLLIATIDNISNNMYMGVRIEHQRWKKWNAISSRQANGEKNEMQLAAASELIADWLAVMDNPKFVTKYNVMWR